MKTKYIVLTATTRKDFDSHGQAFGHCSHLQDKVKAVFKVLSSNTVGAINVWGTGEVLDPSRYLTDKHGLKHRVI